LQRRCECAEVGERPLFAEILSELTWLAGLLREASYHG